MPNNKPIRVRGQTQRAVMTARTKPFLKSWLRNDPMRCCCVLLCRSLLGWESGAMGTYYCSTAAAVRQRLRSVNDRGGS